MKHLKIGVFFAVAALSGMMMANAGHAGRFLASNGMKVVGDPSASGRFEVLQRGGKGLSDYWCAAGEYVIQALRMKTGTRIYLDQKMGPGKMGISNSAGFTAVPDANLLAIAEGQSKGYAMSITKVGDNWPAEHSRAQCSSGRDRLR
jgi:hypothetical protein